MKSVDAFASLFSFNDAYSLETAATRPLRTRIIVAAAVGILAAIVAAFLTHPIRFQGEWVGDIGPPIVGAKLFLDGESPYALLLREGAITLYPFTASVVLSPFLLIPPALWAPVFMGLTTGLLAFGIMTRGRPWQLLALLSPCFMTAMHSVQWSPALAAGLLLPFLLPLVVVKPQIGLALTFCGRWRPATIALAAGIVVLSIVLFPSWPLAWLSEGNLDLYAGSAPITILPGVVLLTAGWLFRTRRGRLLLLMSLVRQRYYYDQFLLFLIPRTARQMTVLLGTSWIGWFAAKILHPDDLAAGVQYEDVWVLVIMTLYLPALGIVWFNYWNDRLQSADPGGDRNRLRPTRRDRQAE